ncbi:glycosyltransferase [Winogradskyella sp. R77965]|uniref:glycosyltransferase n=1 Tax=Winogradskyella sp. R77965 TaxID=3093872 RepID=UPI0037DC21A9
MQTVVPDYRSNLFNYLKTELNEQFVLYGGKEYFEKSVKSDSALTFYNKVNNIYFLNRKILIQLGFWEIILKDNLMVLELNPRIISNWIILLLRKMTQKKTILWGHAWPRNGISSKTDWLRGLMRNLADGIMVYTATQKKELQKKIPNKQINYAPNSLYFRNQMSVDSNENEIKNLMFVGRLTKAKKPLFLVKAFHNVLDKMPKDTKLIVIGEGGEKSSILNYIREHNLENQIRILGHIGDHKTLKSHYDKALFSVSPGYVGLSITQSLGFGVPMLISKEEPHSPEIEAVKENENALFFKSNDMVALGNTLIKIQENKKAWIRKRLDIMEFCKENYSIEAMGSSFISLLKNDE